MKTAWLVGLAAFIAVSRLSAQTPDSLRGRLSNEGVLRASVVVDSVFLDRTKPVATIDGGDWASYLLARLGAGRIPDGLGIEVVVDTVRILVRGRLQDLPPETRGLLGPVASMVDSSTMIVADVIMQRTGREVVRFWLRGLSVSGFPFPEFLLGSMMASIGRQYPALTASGRDLYVQVPPDGQISLQPGSILISAPAVPTKDGGAPPRPRGID
ncbi:MAG: hypothetical protein ACKVZ0_01630 [Gemmatimonadales bacterium]